MKYNKEEVMQELWNEIMVFSLGDIQTGDKKKLVELLSAALDTAHKAGREEMEELLRETLRVLEYEIPLTSKKVIAKIKEALK